MKILSYCRTDYFCFQHEVREEDRRYRAYLAQLKEEEARNERELEKLINEEVEKNWQKKLAQWRMEKEARKKLLQEVLRGRQEQIQLKCTVP